MFVTKELFDEMVGVLIKKCQCIEHDIKIMYAGMLRGDFYKNLDTVVNKPLGPVLKKLEELDYSDESPYLNREDYALLNEIKEIRNYWVHKGYIDFLYGTANGYQKRIDKQYGKLSNDVNPYFATFIRIFGGPLKKQRLNTVASCLLTDSYGI